jgi:hypothetical protein
LPAASLRGHFPRIVDAFVRGYLPRIVQITNAATSTTAMMMLT